MSTRSVIAFGKAADDWRGTYHHSDGYPRGVGATLYKLYNGFFARDLAAMEQFLLDDHPAGWSNINGQDFAQPAGFLEMDHWPRTAEGRIDWAGFNAHGPQCYCHGDRAEAGHGWIHPWGDDWGTEWAYVLTPGHQLIVLKRNYRTHAWAYVTGVALDEPAPDWGRIEELAYERIG